jgi:energy-coupling factor transport system permease protein
VSTPTALPRDLGRTSFTRANPLARLAPATALGVANVITLDPVTPLLTLAVVAVALPATGLSPRQLTRSTWPLLVAAATLLAVNTLADPSPGIGWADVAVGTTTATRLLAVALPGLLAFATIDAVDLTDALVQQLHVPPRFGYGALAALRLMPMLAEDWRHQALAARARGISPRGPVARVRDVMRRVLGLLVTAIRRATRLALALDARGFDGATRATARPSAWTRSDTAWAVGGVGAAAAITVASIALGSWRWFAW